MPTSENPLPTLMPLIEDLISVLIAQDYKSAELTELLIWMNSHCNTCGRLLTKDNQPTKNTPLCNTCS